MSYLKMALQAMKVAADERGGPDHSPPAEVAKLHPDKTPQDSPPESILTCADCDFHKYSGPNPRQGWGHCTFNNKWCYGLRPACSEIQRQDTDVLLDG